MDMPTTLTPNPVLHTIQALFTLEDRALTEHASPCTPYLLAKCESKKGGMVPAPYCCCSPAKTSKMADVIVTWAMNSFLCVPLKDIAAPVLNIFIVCIAPLDHPYRNPRLHYRALRGGKPGITAVLQWWWGRGSATT